MERNEKFFIRASYINRLQCNECGSWCYVHTASDGNYYCDTCMNKALKDGKAILLGF